MPPDVMKPAASGAPWNRCAHASTTSDWISARLGNAAVFSAFSCRNIAATASATSRTSAPPSNTMPNVRPSCQRASRSRLAASASRIVGSDIPCSGSGTRPTLVCLAVSRRAGRMRRRRPGVVQPVVGRVRPRRTSAGAPSSRTARVPRRRRPLPERAHVVVRGRDRDRHVARVLRDRDGVRIGRRLVAGDPR